MQQKPKDPLKPGKCWHICKPSIPNATREAYMEWAKVGGSARLEYAAIESDSTKSSW